MSRIDDITANLGKIKLLIPFLTAGYPSLNSWVKLAHTADESGADIIEIGMPFSDPMADGPEIQHSSFEALKKGLTINDIFKGVEQFRKKSNTPIVLMGYFNPLVARRIENFMKSANSAGVDGLIIPDLPINESATYQKIAYKYALSTIFLVSPTTTDSRAHLIEKASTGFVYAVTVTGVTGSGKVFDSATDNYLRRMRKTLNGPFVAGFGVSTPADARRLGRYANGVVIGSAIVKLLRNSDPRDRAKKLSRFLKSIRKEL